MTLRLRKYSCWCFVSVLFFVVVKLCCLIRRNRTKRANFQAMYNAIFFRILAVNSVSELFFFFSFWYMLDNYFLSTQCQGKHPVLKEHMFHSKEHNCTWISTSHFIMHAPHLLLYFYVTFLFPVLIICVKDLLL